MSEKEKNEKLFIHAFREVRTYILKNQLKQGDILPSEAQLCQEIGPDRLGGYTIKNQVGAESRKRACGHRTERRAQGLCCQR